MNIEKLRELKPALDFIYGLIAEMDEKDIQIKHLQELVTQKADDLNGAIIQINELKKANHAMQLFIEDNVDEEKKKEIFK